MQTPQKHSCRKQTSQAQELRHRECLAREGFVAIVAHSGFPCSPFVVIPCSPFMVALFGPFMVTHCSPFMVIPCSPYMVFSCSPFMVISCSPFMGIPCSPFIVSPCSPCMVIPCSPIYGDSFSPFMLTPKEIVLQPMYSYCLWPIHGGDTGESTVAHFWLLPVAHSWWRDWREHCSPLLVTACSPFMVLRKERKL